MIRAAGDSAVILELEARIDEAVNARAISTARGVRRAAVPGVRDVISTYRSIAVCFDPLHTRIEALTAIIERAVAEEAAIDPPRVVEVPVAYGGAGGPDLGDVARATRLREEEVVRRHTAPGYRVFMLGFVPGFAYLGIVDESIAVPRRGTPRASVAAGSVGIAGRQTGIYPQDSPGGWQIIGRTRVRPFDVMRDPQFFVEAGDRVRFVPVPTIEETGELPRSREQPPTGERGGLVVIRPGMHTTVQDLGRWGYQDRGVPVAGPMDSIAHRVANACVGNPEEAAALEVTLIGPELRFEQNATFAIAGADLGPTLDGSTVWPCTATRAHAGATLRFGLRRSGARASVAVQGGIAVPPVLGSRATHVLSAMGGYRGRPLASGDRLPLAPQSSGAAARRGPADRSMPQRGARLRVLPGPQDDFFAADALERLQQTRFVVSPQSNRMAYRLAGGVIPRIEDREMISDAAFFGGIQVTTSGEPILLMADRQTTGGYPQIATVIAADLPTAGQLAPGDWIEFSICTRREALAALIAQEGQMLALR